MCTVFKLTGEVTYFLWFQGRQQIAANVIESRLVPCAPLYVKEVNNILAYLKEVPQGEIKAKIINITMSGNKLENLHL